MDRFSGFIVPFMVFSVFLTAILRKRPVFEEFSLGASDGMKICVKIFVPIMGFGVAMAAMRSSGLLLYLAKVLSPLSKYVGLNEDLLTMAIFRPLSGSGSIGILADIVKRYGSDSFTAKCACVMMGSTETTFYTLAVYFSATKVRYTGRCLACSLAADAVSILLSLIVCTLMFKG